MPEHATGAIVGNTVHGPALKGSMMPNASRPGRLPRLRRLFALTTDNSPARGYLAVVAASVPVMFRFPMSDYTTGVLLLTSPLSYLRLFLPFGLGIEGSTAAEALAVAFHDIGLLLGALVNAAVLGALVHIVRDHRFPARVNPPRAGYTTSTHAEPFEPWCPNSTC